MTCTKKGPFTPWTLVQNTAVLDLYSHEKAVTIVSAQVTGILSIQGLSMRGCGDQ